MTTMEPTSFGTSTRTHCVMCYGGPYCGQWRDIVPDRDGSLNLYAIWTVGGQMEIYEPVTITDRHHGCTRTRVVLRWVQE